MQRLAATATAFPMTTYEQSNFEQIATAIGIARVAQHKNLFEAAAVWYRLGQRRPKRIAPSKLCEKLDRVAKNARRLLKSLGVNDLDEAPDGPGDAEILNALVLLGEPNEDPVIEATQRIARLAEIIGGVAAAADLERCAKKLLRNELYVGRLVWNRLRYTKNPATGRRVSRVNPREDWICRDVPALRILNETERCFRMASTRPFSMASGSPPSWSICCTISCCRRIAWPN
jgi:hypothetical protein